MHSSCQTLIGRSEVAINEINQPQEEKNLLFVNKKKQKNFVNLALACICARNWTTEPHIA